MKRYFIKHHASSGDSGWGKEMETHRFWLVFGESESEDIVKQKSFSYVNKKGDTLLFDAISNEVVSGGRKPFYKEYHRTKSFMLGVCEFLNSGEILKDTKGYYYISEFCFGREDGEKAMYQIDLIRSDEERSNQIRKNSGGTVNVKTGDVHLFDITCFGREMKTQRKKLMQQVCNACNQGKIMF